MNSCCKTLGWIAVAAVALVPPFAGVGLIVGMIHGRALGFWVDRLAKQDTWSDIHFAINGMIVGSVTGAIFAVVLIPFLVRKILDKERH